MVELLEILSMVTRGEIYDNNGSEWAGTSETFINQFHRLHTYAEGRLHGIEARWAIDCEDLLDKVETLDEKISNDARVDSSWT